MLEFNLKKKLIPILNAVIVFTLMGQVDVVPLNDINTSVFFLNPRKLPALGVLI